jgi:hypothetical protein
VVPAPVTWLTTSDLSNAEDRIRPRTCNGRREPQRKQKTGLSELPGSFHLPHRLENLHHLAALVTIGPIYQTASNNAFSDPTEGLPTDYGRRIKP